MAATVLAPNSTIRTVCPSLAEPEEYTRIVVGHLAKCNKQHGNASVRIGVMGKGVFPCHKVIYLAGDGAERYFQAYDGDREFTDVNIHQFTWSTASMTFRETQELLRELRTVKNG